VMHVWFKLAGLGSLDLNTEATRKGFLIRLNGDL
jgi:hypothetical protein